jgi:hypothetical protein
MFESLELFNVNVFHLFISTDHSLKSGEITSSYKIVTHEY